VGRRQVFRSLVRSSPYLCSGQALALTNEYASPLLWGSGIWNEPTTMCGRIMAELDPSGLSGGSVWMGPFLWGRCSSSFFLLSAQPGSPCLKPQGRWPRLLLSALHSFWNPVIVLYSSCLHGLDHFHRECRLWKPFWCLCE
jgi:hypothetical protein